MRLLVLYDTRHGFTEKCLGLLAGELPPGVDLWPVRRRPGVPNWGSYDAVLFGGPVYFGRWSPALIRYLKRHLGPLLQTPLLAAFIVSLSPRAAALRYFSQGLPLELKGKLGQVACFGGGIRWNETSWWERVILKRVQGIETEVSNLDWGEIQALGAWLSAKLPPA